MRLRYFFVNALDLLMSDAGYHAMSKMGYVHPFLSFSLRP